VKELFKVDESMDGAVRSHYTAVAERGASCCSGEGGSCGDSYTADQLTGLNPEAAAASAGCGNPVALAEVNKGEVVLDLGSGGGIDCFLAARATGPSGKVIGVDLTPAMVALARANAAKLGTANVVFKLGRIESIPEPDGTVDMVMSNCVINLSQRKDLVFAEVFRVLQPGGRMVVSDIVSTAPMPAELRTDPAQWAACVAGADEREEYLGRVRSAGFERIEVLADVPSGSCGDGSAELRSITVRAYKPAAGAGRNG
jgi:SAM-dependent methyltransferase